MAQAVLLGTSSGSSAAAQALVSDEQFTAFVEAAAECADSPVPSLLHKDSMGVETRLGTLNVEAKWLSSQPRLPDDITVCTNSNFERWV